MVQDVVFNPLNASGEGPNSDLDEVVPNYYYTASTPTAALGNGLLLRRYGGLNTR